MIVNGFETNDSTPLTRDQIDRLADLVTEYRTAVHNGEVVGYGQSKEDEMKNLNDLVRALGAMRS